MSNLLLLVKEEGGREGNGVEILAFFLILIFILSFSFRFV